MTSAVCQPVLGPVFASPAMLGDALDGDAPARTTRARRLGPNGEPARNTVEKPARI